MPSINSFSYHNTSIEAVIFDLDGTLYDQRKMRIYMLFDLFFYYLVRPHRLYELRIIYYFRKKRYELVHEANLEEAQYEHIAHHLHHSQAQVKKVISLWIEERPLRYMRRCRYPYIVPLFKAIRARGMKIAVVSDYPVEKKLHALGLEADGKVCSTESEVNHFKPHPQGFLIASQRLGVSPRHCIVIGDRDDKDGDGARNAGMLFIKIDTSVLAIFS